jgi:Asp-tRNA(Asn)/Glu-tRNA(Gln) amidotransferase A subunit family amidase
MAADLRIMRNALARANDARFVTGVAMGEKERASLRSYAAAIHRLSGLISQALTAPRPVGAAAEFSPIAFPKAPKLADASQRRRSPAALQVETSLARLKDLDGRLQAVIEIFSDVPSDAARQDGADHSLRGLPVIVKDVIDVAGSPTRANCHALDRQPAAQDAAVVARLRRAGGIPVAKAVSWELSFAETDDASALHPRAINPWSPRHDTGGSSSGVAAAIAAGACPAGLGSDTGGSSRGPASWCGIVGFKPTTGLLPTRGMLPLSPSFDCAAVMAQDVEVCRRLFAALAGVPAAKPERASGRFRLALWRDAYRGSAPADAEVAALVENAMARLAASGVEIVEVRLPSLDLYSAAFVVLARRETFATWGRLLNGDPALLGVTLRERLLACGLFSDTLVEQARELQTCLDEAARHALADVDAIVLPTTPTAAPLTSGAAGPMAFDKPAYVRFASLLGLPSLSLPCGLTAAGLPVGLMLSGRPGEDRRLLETAAAVEQLCPPLGPAPAFRQEA